MRDIVYHISRWLISVALVALAIYLFYSQVYLVYGPKVGDMDARLPLFLHPSPVGFWLWLLLSGTVGGVVGTWTVRRWRRQSRPSEATADASDEATAELTRAGEAIAHLRDGHDRDPAFLLIAGADAGPSGPSALLAAGGMPPDAVVPDDPAPIRGYRTAEGLFLRTAGPDTRGATWLAQLLPSLPGRPSLRGVVVAVPVGQLRGSAGRSFGQGSRAVLRALAESSATRCPVYVVVTGMEAVPGFLEFAHRTPAEYRTSARFGFSLPSGAGGDSSSAAVAREYDRLVAWYWPSILDMMEAHPLAQEGNEALFRLGRWFLDAREPVLQVLDAVRPGGDDPMDLLNCYFAATGEGADRHAFAEGVLRGKVTSDPRAVRWSTRTLASDRRLGRLALALGIGGGLGAILAWTLIFVHLRPTGWTETLLATGLAVGWIATWYELIRGFPRRRSGAR